MLERPAPRMQPLLPAAVVTVALSSPHVRDIQVALEGSVAVWESSSPRHCAKVLEQHTHICVLLRVPTAAESGLGEHLLVMRRQFPHVPCVALFEDAESDSRWALRLGAIGVSELIPFARHIPSAPLQAALARTEVESVSTRIWKTAHVDVPEELVSILKPALRLAHGPVSLVRLANARRMHERSLRKYCDQRGYPSPQWIIGWARLLVAAYYLDEPGRTIQSVANLLEFPSPVALSNHVRRYTGLTPSMLRVRGALCTVARLLEGRVAVRAPELATTVPLLRLV